MDQELIAYFDARFQQVTSLQEETRREVTSLREETIGQVANLHEETIGQLTNFREETIGQLTNLREETIGQITDLREETGRRFEQIESRLQRMEDTDRQTLVVIEGLRHEMHLVAEGVLGLDERLRRYHNESTVAFDQVKGWIEPYYRDLNGRLTVMESRADRQQGDVMDAIRKLVGHPPIPRPVPSE